MFYSYDPKLKIVVVHTDFRIYWPARLSALTEYLNNNGVELEIVEISGVGSPYEFFGQLTSRPSNWSCLFASRRMEDISPAEANAALERKFDYLDPDIIFAGAIAFPSGAVATRWAAERNRKVVIFDDARLQDIPRSCVVNFIKRKIYSSVNAIFCPSPAWISTFNYYGFKNDQLFFGVDVVDNRYWQNSEKPDSKLLLSNRYFISVGRQIWKKNFIQLLRAYEQYARRVKNPKELVLVGEGPERNELETYLKTTRLTTVRLLPFQPQEALRSLFHGAHSFVLPSRYGETWGLVVNEAMASGLPIIVSNQVGCASTLVKEGVNGYTFSPDNVNELTYLLVKMDAIGTKERMEMGERSKEIINDWGLDRFCQGAYDAIQFVSGSAAKKPGLITKLILKFWKGRYRPV